MLTMHIIVVFLVLLGFLPIIEKLKRSVDPFRGLWFTSCMCLALVIFIITYSDPSLYWLGFAGIITYGLFTAIRRYRLKRSPNGPQNAETA